MQDIIADLRQAGVATEDFCPIPDGMIAEQAPHDSAKKKVLLVLPNHHWATEDQFYTKWIIYPTQICLLAAQIEDRYNVTIVDCIVDDLSEEDFAAILRRENPDVVGVSNFTHEYSKAGHTAVKMAKQINPNCKTFMGGVYVITSPDLAIANPDLDYAIIGEGEEMIQSLLSHVFEGGPRPTKGLAFREQGNIVIQARADFISNLDKLKYPAYHLIDFLKYATRYQRETVSRPRALPFARVCMTRGCPIGCTFCTVESISGGPTRYRSAAHMVGEIQMLHRKYGLKSLLWDDDNLFMNKHKAKEMLSLLISKNLDLVWLYEATAIFCMDEELIELCAQSGCKYLNIAIESGSDRVLREVIKKPIFKPRLRELIQKMKDVGIEINSNFVIGNPGETWDEILETVQFAEEIDIDYVKFFICTPFPQTKMFEMAKERGYIDKDFKFDEHNWSGGTFNTEFWKAGDLAIIRAYEWDRINFANPVKRKKIMEMMDVSPERLEEIRTVTRSVAIQAAIKAESLPEFTATPKLKVNRYLTTKDKSKEQASQELHLTPNQESGIQETV